MVSSILYLLSIRVSITVLKLQLASRRNIPKRMKLSVLFLITLTKAHTLENAGSTGTAIAAFDEHTPYVAKIGCGRGTINVTKVRF